MKTLASLLLTYPIQIGFLFGFALCICVSYRRLVHHHMDPVEAIVGLKPLLNALLWLKSRLHSKPRQGAL
jgi:hypothetical protein